METILLAGKGACLMGYVETLVAGFILQKKVAVGCLYPFDI
jgi:hypothetical protein